MALPKNEAPLFCIVDNYVPYKDWGNGFTTDPVHAVYGDYVDDGKLLVLNTTDNAGFFTGKTYTHNGVLYYQSRLLVKNGMGRRNIQVLNLSIEDAGITYTDNIILIWVVSNRVTDDLKSWANDNETTTEIKNKIAVKEKEASKANPKTKSLTGQGDSLTPDTKKTNWKLYGFILGGLAILGTIAYFVFKPSTPKPQPIQ